MSLRFFANLYAAGEYHRKGKPGVTDVHLGDLYVNYIDAMRDAEPEKGFIATVEVLVPAQIAFEHETKFRRNPDDSVPVPLSQTRKGRVAHVVGAPAHTIGMRPLSATTAYLARAAEVYQAEQIAAAESSLETSEAEAQPWPGAAVHGLEHVYSSGTPHHAVAKPFYGAGKAYKPTHGGYPT